jgi:SAM-dependent methyltransferase
MPISTSLRPGAPDRAVAHHSRYAALWDDYSQLWDRDPWFRQYKHLGDEWGSPQWVDHVIATYAQPWLSPSAEVVEIGPGGGRYTCELLSRAASVTGVDVSPRMLARASGRFAGNPKFHGMLGSGTDLAGIPSGTVDFVFAFNVFIQLLPEDIYSYFLEIGRVLRDGGVASIHYATLSSEEGWKHFDANRTQWSASPCARGRFTCLPMQAAELFATRAGLAVIRHQFVGRDAVLAMRNADAADSPAPGATRRDFRHIDRHLDELASDIYHELPTPHHREAARETVDEYLRSIEFESVIELGCGAAPTLDFLAAMGKRTKGLSLGFESCSHPILRADMQFSGLRDGATDLVVARHVLEHSPMPLLLLMEMARITTRYALVVVPCDEEIWVNWPNHYSVFGRPAWRRLFDRAGFTIEREGDGRLEPDSTEWRFLLKKKHNG